MSSFCSWLETDINTGKLTPNIVDPQRPTDPVTGEMASPPQLACDDGAPLFAARQVPGCFTSAQVQKNLGQPVRPADHEVEPITTAVTTPRQIIGRDSDGHSSHFLSGCACSPLHSQCSDPEPKPGVGCKVTFTPDQLRVAAEAGCLFCRAIYGGIKSAPPWDPSRKVPTQMLPSFELNSARWEGQDAGIMLFQPLDPPIMMYIDKKTAGHSPCRMFRARPNLASTTDAEDIISYIRRFNHDCHDNHSCSPAQDSSFRPTRLVQVDIWEGKYALKLVQGEAVQEPDRYLTLSHCWGANMPSSAKTLASTLQDNLVSIPWEGLTQTFRDAVAMTERLGYTHIWIDSLCILQDSKADWEAEAAVMGQVYANCDLMLSADGAPEGSIGLFRSAQISSKPWQPSGVDGTILDALRFAYIKHHRTFGQMVQMFVSPDEWAQLCPLNTRAWCYQEWRLAPRIIRFGMDELHWDCQRGGLCQCGAFGDIPFPTERAQMYNAETAAVFKSRMEKEQLWDQSITGYSERSLTVWTDRLPALSGLAKRFLPRCLDSTTATLEETQFDKIDLGSYLAGLWFQYLSRGLCWSADYRPGIRVSTPDRYVAPSWSWLSVSGQVQVITPKDFEPVADVISAKCTPTSKINTMGAISYGEVVLRAKVISLSAFRGVVGERQRQVYLHVECADPQDTTKQVCPGTFRPDATPHLDGGLADASFFAGCNYQLADPNVKGKDLEPLNDGGGAYFGVHMAKMFIMVVRPAANGEKDTYERAGSIFWSGFSAEKSDKSRFFEGVEATVIKLI